MDPHIDPQDYFLFAISSTDSCRLQADIGPGIDSVTVANENRKSIDDKVIDAADSTWHIYSISYDFNGDADEARQPKQQHVGSTGDHTSVSQTVTDDNTVDTWYDCPTDFVQNDQLIDTDMNTFNSQCYNSPQAL